MRIRICRERGKKLVVSWCNTAELGRSKPELLVSKEQRCHTADNAIDVIWTMNLEGRITYISSSIEKLTGFTSNEFMQQSLEDMFTYESLGIVQEGLSSARSIVQAGLPVNFQATELEALCKDGSTVWTEVTVTSVYDGNGRFLELLGMTRKINKRKSVRNRTRKSQNCTEAPIGVLSDLMIRVDREGNIHEFRATPFNRLFSYPSLYVGKKFIDVFPEAASKVFLTALDEAVIKGSHLGATYSLLTPNGLSWFEISITAMNIPTEPDDQFIVQIRDITQYKRQEPAPLKIEHRNRNILNNSPEVIWVWDIVKQRFIYMSPSIYDLRGFTAEEIMLQPIDVSMDPEFNHLIKEELPKQSSTRPCAHEINQIRKDGSVVPTEVLTTLLTDTDGHPCQILGITRDITERKRVDAALRIFNQ